MIPRYTDHAANERTYLAWIRTAIAIMAFGFLIEKFHLFLTLGVKFTGHDGVYDPIEKDSAEVVGVTLVVLGMLIIVGASVRFLLVMRRIRDESVHQFDGAWANLILAALIFAMGGFLLAYLTHIVIS